MRLTLFLLFGLLFSIGCETPSPEPAASESITSAEAASANRIPDWANDAVFYQIFPERFRNGDLSNDPTRESLETPIDRVPESWEITPWTSDWYARAPWEVARGEDFYEDGVFDRRYGGDLQGVVDKLDYMRDLGINTIYFNPVFYARSLHKYDGNTFHHVDPHFGPDPAGDFALMATETSDPSTWQWTEADLLFLSLLEEAHARNIRVIIDGVFNHTGRDFFAFDDLRRNQQDSPYTEWYIVNAWDDPATADVNEFNYEGWWGVETLPVFADNADGSDLHPAPKQYVFDATTRWMDPNGDGNPEDGIDGWRLDVANEVPLQFWADWNDHVFSLNPEAYTVTEIWHDAAQFLADGGFSATMNYHGFAFPVKGFLIDGTSEPSTFASMINERREEYPMEMQFVLQNLIDSHDTDRLASMIVNEARQPYENEESAERYGYDWGSRVSPRNTDHYLVRAPNEREWQIQKLVALFQMTYVGAPMIYYGTEAGMWGADDPDDRKPMVWDDLTYDPETRDPLGRPRPADPVAFNHDLFAFYKDVISLRQEHAALRRGDFEVLAADDDSNTLVYSRSLEGETYVIVLNRSDDTHTIRVPFSAPGMPEVLFSTTDEGSQLEQDGDALLLEVPELSGLVLQ